MAWRARTDAAVGRAHPPAPWSLHGRSAQILRLIDVGEARRIVPRGLRIVPVWPGKTLGVLYCARYEPPSTLCYHELLVAPALVAARGRVGFWISHIWVDDAASQAGGCAIWRLPKALATFSWDPERREASVRCASGLLCRIRWGAASVSVPTPLYLPVITRDDSGLLFFTGRGSALAGPRRGEIDMARDGPLAWTGFANARTLILAHGLRLRVRPPSGLR